MVGKRLFTRTFWLGHSVFRYVVLSIRKHSMETLIILIKRFGFFENRKLTVQQLWCFILRWVWFLDFQHLEPPQNLSWAIAFMGKESSKINEAVTIWQNIDNHGGGSLNPRILNVCWQFHLDHYCVFLFLLKWLRLQWPKSKSLSKWK